MSDPLVINPKECQGLSWQLPHDLAFATGKPLMPLNARELAKAAATMPLALVKDGRDWNLVGVCGLDPSRNLFIKNGTWLGNYRPEWLGTWPFEIVNVGDRNLFTFDRDSGLLRTEGEGEPFFDTQDRMSAAVSSRVDMLKTAHGAHQVTRTALSELAKARVVTPWPDALRSQLGLSIDGLHMIDEKALASLDDETFLGLRKAQALPIAYAVNLSIAQTHLLGRLAKLDRRGAPASQTLDSLLDGDDDPGFNFDA